MDSLIEDYKDNKINKSLIDNCVISSIIRSIGYYNSDWYQKLDLYRNKMCDNISNFYGTGMTLEQIDKIERVFMSKYVNNKLATLEANFRATLSLVSYCKGLRGSMIENEINKRMNPPNVNKKFQTNTKQSI